MGFALYDFILKLDYAALRLINVTLENAYLDQVWLFITQMHKYRVMWIILALLLGYAAYIYRRRLIQPMLALTIAVALADTIAYRVIKQVVDRPRPFQNEELRWVRKIGQAHGPSFPSNHAANCFAGAMVLAWYFPSLTIPVYILAVLVAFSRPALGLHYPSDVLAGAILGIFVGWLVIRFTMKRIRRGNRDDDSWNWRSKSRRLSSN